MTKAEQIKRQKERTKRALKKCEVAINFKGFGFKTPVINRCGKCGGCYNPDDNELEQKCRTCKVNEYFIDID